MSESRAKPTLTMAELAERDVSGDMAVIYDEIRVYSAVPYVSSLQRHVATMPGALEYAWAICRPAFVSGQIPETAWRLAASIPVEPFPPLSEAALRLLGVDGNGLSAIRNICRNFVRVAPVNLLFAGVVERLLQGAEPAGVTSVSPGWTPPVMLAPMPALRDMGEESDDVQAVLMQLATELGGKPFVPGLYRLLADWPGYLAHAATLVEPLLKSDSARAARVEISQRIVAAADDILPNLAPRPSHLTAPSVEQSHAIISAIHTYRVTSPEMVVLGSLLENALPPAG